MKRKALIRDFFKRIRNTMGRFMSITLICMLGVAFYSGLSASKPDMRLTGDTYYKDNRLMDIKIVSTYGLTDDDVSALAERDDISAVMGAYSLHALLLGEESESVVAIHGADFDKIISGDATELNVPKLTDGRFPESDAECVVEQRVLDRTDLKIGDKISIHSGNSTELSESLKYGEFTIVGVVISPLYLSINHGTSNIGNGEIQCFMYVPNSAFAYDVYTEIYVLANGSEELFSFDDEYEDFVADAIDALELLAPEREQARYDSVIAEAVEELADARAELEDGKRERDDELADARTELADARVKLNDGEREYFDGVNEFNASMTDAEAELADGTKKLNDGQRALNDAKAAIESGRTELETNAASLSSAKTQAEAGRDEIAAQRRLLDGAGAQLEEARTQLDQLSAGIAEIEQLLAAYEAGYPLPEGYDAQALYAELEGMKTQSEQGEALYAQNKADYDAGLAALTEGEIFINASLAQIDEGEARIDAARLELDEGEATLNSEQAKLDDARRELAEGRRKLDEGRAEGEEKLADARLELDDGWKEYYDGIVKYNEGAADSMEEIRDAERKIADAQQELDDLKMPQWYIFDRQAVSGYQGYIDDTYRIGSIVRVFPMIFYLIALFVTLITLMRLVDEERGKIGTLKAMGYSDHEIALSYVGYAILACIFGGVIGIAVGLKVLPVMIANAYSSLYRMPPLLTPFVPGPPLTSLGIMLALTSLASAWSAIRKLAKQPATLLRPKAPKPGKRVILERIGFIWNRMSFSYKVTARNILRYKSRFIMTVLGICGCTALLLTGFGLKDSINSVVSDQFGKVWLMDIQLMFRTDGDEEDVQGHIRELLDSTGNIASLSLYQQAAMKAEGNGSQQNAYAIITDDPETFTEMIVLNERTTGNTVTLEKGRVVISEKLAKLLGLKVGDTIKLEDSDHKVVNVKVSGITQNYVSHYVYMLADDYAAMFDAEYEPNVASAKLRDTGDAAYAAMSTPIVEDESTLSLTSMRTTERTVSNQFSSLNMIVVVLIVVAGMLAGVVMFNLTNINISERTRELATIKVLGFTDGEMGSYVFRENIILAFVGTLFGLVAGIFLHRYVLSTAEPDMIMFGMYISPLSYLWSAGLTTVFAWAVNLIMYPRIIGINMVESLKSIE